VQYIEGIIVNWDRIIRMNRNLRTMRLTLRRYGILLGVIALTLILTLLSCGRRTDPCREYIDLSGKWQFALDTLQSGEEQEWYRTDLEDVVTLPGTTDENGKGFLNRDVTTLHLNRVYRYEGMAWYRKEVTIPPGFKGKHLCLFLERTKPTRVWIDSIFVGGSRLLQSPQMFDVSAVLSPGKHHITIRVNNDLALTPYGNVHIYSDDTQTNWNGIIGKMYIEASARTRISRLRVFPDIEKRQIAVELEISDPHPSDQMEVELQLEKTSGEKTKRLKSRKSTVDCTERITLEYDLGDECSLWDEYRQAVYTLTATIHHDDTRDSRSVVFGMRDFDVKGTQFSINGRTVFLRGKNDAAVFPLTGYTPMETEDWLRVFRIARSYGINHYRFHSNCPPEAAFAAADRLGIFLQVELPFWGGVDSDALAQSLLEEGYAMLDAYANHPSFVLFSHGNEIWGGYDRVEANIIALKEYDSRPLYTMGSNNGIGYTPPRACSDFFVGARTPYAYDTILTHLRLTHSFADSRDGGILNTRIPATEICFDYPVSHMDIPLVSHEIGQYQIFPDYREIDKYTGVLRARNLEVFRDRLEKAGMGHMDSIFQQASGIWSALCYKAEMEAALRTEGFAGFQLLDLQDFPGQGTAMVGILDAFMDSKEVITPEAWKQSCDDVVILLEFPKYCWTRDESYQAGVRVANYSDHDIAGELSWNLCRQDGSVVAQGVFQELDIPHGGICPIGDIRADLSSLDHAERLNLQVQIAGMEYANSYPVWVYAPAGKIEIPEGLLVTEKLDDQAIDALEKGGRVLLFPQTEDVDGRSVPGLFPPDFWNYGMFKGISERNGKPVSPGTLGILTDPAHPIFRSFPTDFHTHWQWFSIIKASHAMILDPLPGSYQPIVRVIDNMERNHRLGLIFEFSAGDGKLLVCMSRLNRIADQPEARQLYQSLIRYMMSEDFEPGYEVNMETLTRLFL
jgi:hypothetical protein